MATRTTLTWIVDHLSALSSMESSDVNSLSVAISGLSSMESSDVNSLSAAISGLSSMESSDVSSLSTAISALSSLESSDVNSLSVAISGLSSMESSDVNSLSVAISGLSSMESSDVNSLSTAIANLGGIPKAITLAADAGSDFVLTEGSGANDIPAVNDLTDKQVYVFKLTVNGPAAADAAPAKFAVPTTLLTDKNPIVVVSNRTLPNDQYLNWGRIEVTTANEGVFMLEVGETYKFIKGLGGYLGS